MRDDLCCSWRKEEANLSEEEPNEFRLEGVRRATAEGLKHLPSPPKIVGQTDHGEKPSLTFYFDNESQKEEVLKYFRDGKSRVPSGKKLYEAVKELGKRIDTFVDQNL